VQSAHSFLLKRFLSKRLDAPNPLLVQTKTASDIHFTYAA